MGAPACSKRPVHRPARGCARRCPSAGCVDPTGPWRYARTPPSLAGQELLGREWAEHAERVAVWIRHHHPAGFRTLAHIRAARAEFLQSGNLISLIARSQIEVQTILACLFRRNADEHEVWHDSVFGTTRRRL